MTICDPMDYSTPGFPVLYHLPEFAQTRPLSQWCYPTTLSYVAHFSYPHSFPTSFTVSWLFTLGGQSIGALASASVLLMNIQSWFPLRWTGLISFLSKGLSRVFSNTTVRKHQFFCYLTMIFFQQNSEDSRKSQRVGSPRVRRTTGQWNFFFFFLGQWNFKAVLQYSCLENPMERGGWWATHSPWGQQSQTQLSKIFFLPHHGTDLSSLIRDRMLPWQRKQSPNH